MLQYRSCVLRLTNNPCTVYAVKGGKVYKIHIEILLGQDLAWTENSVSFYLILNKISMLKLH